MPFKIIRNDITKVKADAIVNTANPNVAIGSGVDSAIYEAAGKEKLLAARSRIGRLEPGEAGITPAFALDAKYIIHVSGPKWKGGENGEVELLRQCYEKSLKLASEKKCKSIAFPLLATGFYGFPKKIGIEIAVDAFTKFLEEHDMDILLVVFGSNAVKISGELVENVSSYIDDRYVSDALDEEYPKGRITDETTDDSASRILRKEISVVKAVSAGSIPFVGGLNKKSSKAVTAGSREKLTEKDSLDEKIKGIYKESFHNHLQKLINKKGLKNSEVYSVATISKQAFSKIINGKTKPTKETVLALAIGLKLSMDETIDFLKIAGYALSPISQTDLVVEYFIEHSDYSVIKINMVLFDYGLNPLSNG